MSAEGVYCNWCPNHCKIGDIAYSCPATANMTVSVSKTGTIKKTVDGKTTYKSAYVAPDIITE